jgi:hypothetical protein
VLFTPPEPATCDQTPEDDGPDKRALLGYRDIAVARTLRYHIESLISSQIRNSTECHRLAHAGYQSSEEKKESMAENKQEGKLICFYEWVKKVSGNR